MSVFPLAIVQKEDTAERLLALANLPEKHKFTASDQNEIVAAIKELHAKGFYMPGTTGIKWYVRKAENKVNIAFEEGDKIEAFIDSDKKQWREGIVLDSTFRGVADLNDKTKFFITNSKTRFE